MSLLLAPAGRWQRFAARHNLWSGLPWLLLIGGAVVAQFVLGIRFNSNETTNLYLRLSRGCAWALLVVLAVLWLPVMRHAVSTLRRSRIGELLPLDKAKVAHRWLGHFFVALALAHGANQLAYLGTLNAPFADVLFGREADLVRAMRTTMNEFVSDDDYIMLAEDWIAAGLPREAYDAELGPFIEDECGKCHSPSSTQTYAVPKMPLTSYEEVAGWVGDGWQSRQFRINVSGLVLFALASALWALSLARVRRRQHPLFQQSHRLGYVLALILLLHVPTLAWLYLPLAVLGAEYYLSRRRHLYRGCVAHLSPVAGNIVRLDIDSPPGVRAKAGDYVRLRIPALSPSEWHDFSLAGEDDEAGRLVLKIRCLGDWTGRLQDLLADGDDVRLTVDLRGPYASPAAHAVKAREWVLVAGGIGITPILGLLRELLRAPDGRRDFHLVWMLREPALLEWMRPLVEGLCARRDVRCHWYFYLTDPPADGQGTPVWLERVQGESGVRLRSGLPDWPALAAEIAAGCQRPTCFVCGPDALARDTMQVCRRLGWPVRRETF
jgi:NADPH oxidase 1